MSDNLFVGEVTPITLGSVKSSEHPLIQVLVREDKTSGNIMKLRKAVDPK